MGPPKYLFLFVSKDEFRIQFQYCQSQVSLLLPSIRNVVVKDLENDPNPDIEEGLSAVGCCRHMLVYRALARLANKCPNSVITERLT